MKYWNVCLPNLSPIIKVIFMLVAVQPFLPNCFVVAQEPQEVGLCELTAHPDQFNKKQIRVHARFETVVIEGGMWLVSDACPKELVTLDVPEPIRKHPEQHPDYAALEDAILKQGNLGTAGKTITATFSGRFIYARHKRPKRVLLLEKIENLETKYTASDPQVGGALDSVGGPLLILQLGDEQTMKSIGNTVLIRKPLLKTPSLLTCVLTNSNAITHLSREQDYLFII